MLNDTEERQEQYSLISKALELAYEESRREVDHIYSDENGRQLRVQNMLLEAERDDLRDEVAQSDNRIQELETCLQELQQSLDSTFSQVDIAQGELRIRKREIETLKVMLHSTELGG